MSAQPNSPQCNLISDWFYQALCLLFIALKLMGYIAWSWWLVFAPLWLPIAVAPAMEAICFLVVGIIAAWEAKKQKE